MQTNVGAPAAAMVAGQQSSDHVADVYYVVEMLDKLRSFAEKQGDLVQGRRKDELSILTAAEQNAPTEADKKTLQFALQQGQLAQVEAQSAKTEMLSFYYTLKSALGSQSGAPSCQYLRCGKHAGCNTQQGRVQCECHDGYQGDGITCHPKTHFAAQSMLFRDSTPPPQISEVSLAVLSAARVAVAVRDSADGEKGLLILGKATAGSMTWGPAKAFSEAGAFGIQVSALPSGRLVLSFRDLLKGGVGYLAGARVDLHSPSPTLVALSSPRAISRGQSEAAVLLPLASSKVGCFYADSVTPLKAGMPIMHFGSALIAGVSADGAINVGGRYRFHEGPVSQLAATLLTPSTFVIAYRGSSLGVQSAGSDEETSVVWAQVKDGEFVVDPHPLLLDQNAGNVQARDVALVSDNMFAYSYQSVSEKETKMAVVYVDPVSHKMTVTAKPNKISKGKSPFVRQLSYPYGSKSPHSLTYLQAEGEESSAVICRVTFTGAAEGCHHLNWSGTKVVAASAGSLWDGRVLFVYANENGALFYQHVVLYPSDPPAEAEHAHSAQAPAPALASTSG